MELLDSLFVGKPLNILVVATLFLSGYLVSRFKMTKSGGHHRALLWAAIAWGLFSLWEFLVQIRTPEANIRVDLLVICPGLAILSAWAIYRSFQ